MQRRTFLKAAPMTVAAGALKGTNLFAEPLERTAELFVSLRDAAPAVKPVQAVEGIARFTVITAECIRMEYAPHYGFVDAPTLFAINRGQTYPSARISRSGRVLTIDTEKLRLEYQPDGTVFSENNLRVSFGSGQKSQTWNPNLKNGQNLKGPVATLDGVKAPFELPDGILSKDGWYLLDDSGRPVFVDGWIRQRIGGGPQGPDMPSGINPDVDWYLFAYGDDYKTALKSLTAISGPVPMPRREVHGSWYCRWFPYTADQFREIVAGYKTHDFPMDILVMDMEWHTKDAKLGFGHAHQLGWTGYTWNRKLIPDPGGLLKELRDDGIHVTLNDHPADGIRQNEECYPLFMRLLEAKTGESLPFDAGNRRYMKAFFEASHKPIEEQGVDFWWVDWQQDYILPWVHGVPGLRHLPWLNYLYYQRSQEGNLRGQGFSRWGGWGDHKHPIQFSGDAHSSWEMLAFEIYFTLASGNAGCFFWAHDLGGFYGSKGTEEDSELYTRWVQFGALSSSLRLHSNPSIDRRPWLWGNQFEDAMRKAFHLRSQLFPYVYTSVRQCYEQSLPLLRPMYLEYPNEEAAYEHKAQYMFGDHLLVAPITTASGSPDLSASQSMWFPPGTWYNLCKEEKVEGGKVISITAKLSEIPVYVRAGIPLPMQPYTPRMASTPLTHLIVRIYPGEHGEVLLYEDDGRSQGYTQQRFARTKIRQNRAGGEVHIHIAPVEGHYDGQPLHRSYRIELPYTRKAESALFNGTSIRVAYDAQTNTNTVEIPSSAISADIHCVVNVTHV